MNDALNNIKRLRDVLNEAIAAMEAGREAKIEEKLPYGGAWVEVIELVEREYRCTIRPREIWVNEYVGGLAGVFDSKKEADERATPNRIRCTRFVEAPNDEP